jgi:hypothetical protein
MHPVGGEIQVKEREGAYVKWMNLWLNPTGLPRPEDHGA